MEEFLSKHIHDIFLSLDKQFLITRNVACYRRCKQMEYVGEETMVENDGPDADGWVETHHFDSNNMTELEDNVCEMTLDSTKVNYSSWYLFIINIVFAFRLMK